jgi:hypothetical protein
MGASSLQVLDRTSSLTFSVFVCCREQDLTGDTKMMSQQMRPWICPTKGYGCVSRADLNVPGPPLKSETSALAATSGCKHPTCWLAQRTYVITCPMHNRRYDMPVVGCLFFGQELRYSRHLRRTPTPDQRSFFKSPTKPIFSRLSSQTLAYSSNRR